MKTALKKLIKPPPSLDRGEIMLFLFSIINLSFILSNIFTVSAFILSQVFCKVISVCNDCPGETGINSKYLHEIYQKSTMMGSKLFYIIRVRSLFVAGGGGGGGGGSHKVLVVSG